MSKVAPNKPLLILLYGYPGSGKTFFARQLSENFQAAHLHSERIRGELFENPHYDKEENDVITQLMDYMAGEFLSAGLSVVYDGNSLRTQSRRALRDMARKYRAQPVLVWFQVDAETSFGRLQRRDRRRADDKYAGPNDRATFERVAGAMQNPQNEDYIVVSGKHTFETQLSAFIKRMRELGLVPDKVEVSAKVVKPGLVNLVPNPTAGRVDMSRRNIVIR
ncbi:MAG TPA: ATP-binding protein [Candidatus Saccharimonadales bacterium]|nr:ATP-binding protein [Candidatus Saccharimonadales bacterium]